MNNKKHLLIFLSILSLLSLSAESLQSAEEAYLEGDLLRALNLYQSVGSEFKTAEYYQNLSVLYQRLGDYPRALESVRRSLEIKPWNTELREHRIYLLNEMSLASKPPEKLLIEKIFFWYGALRSTHWYIAGILFFNLFCFIMLFWRKRNNAFWMATLFLALSLICFLSLGVYVQRSKHRITVLLQNSPIYRERGRFQEPLQREEFPAGTELRIEETRGQWQRVKLNDNREGWLDIGD